VALSIGSGVLSSTYLSDPPRPEERARLRKAALRELAHAPERECDRLLPAGGPPPNLPILLSRQNPPTVLTTADLLTCASRLDAGKAAQVGEKYGLEPSGGGAVGGGV